MILVDTNVLLRLIQIGHPHQEPALEAIALLHTRDHEQFAICPQILYEVYAVCTRPANAANAGLALSPTAAIEQLDRIQRQFSVTPEPLEMLSRWKELVVNYHVIGKSSHDARLAALMIEQGIPRLLTFNDSHFARFTHILAVNPFDVLGIDRI